MSYALVSIESAYKFPSLVTPSTQEELKRSMLSHTARVTQLLLVEPSVGLWLPYPSFDAGTMRPSLWEADRGHKVTESARIQH